MGTGEGCTVFYKSAYPYHVKSVIPECKIWYSLGFVWILLQLLEFLYKTKEVRIFIQIAGNIAPHIGEGFLKWE